MRDRHGGVHPVHGLAAQLGDEVGVGRVGTQKYRVEAGLARFANGANGLADDGSQHYQVAVGALHFCHLGRKIGSPPFEGCFLGHLHVDGFQARLGTAQHFQAKVVILVNSADPFCIFFFDQFGQGSADLVVVSDGKRVLEPVKRLVHVARRRDGQEVDDVLLKLHRHGGVVLRGAHMAGHDENLVLVHQLLRAQHGLLGVIPRVFQQQLELAAMHAALLIELVNAQLHAVACLLAKRRQRPRHVLNGANQDFGFGHTLICY